MIRTDNYAADILEDARNDVEGEAASTSAENFFVANENPDMLSEGYRN